MCVSLAYVSIVVVYSHRHKQQSCVIHNCINIYWRGTTQLLTPAVHTKNQDYLLPLNTLMENLGG